MNGGSLERPLLDKVWLAFPEALSESALNAVHALEDEGFTNMKVSSGFRCPSRNRRAYHLFSTQSNYPCISALPKPAPP